MTICTWGWNDTDQKMVLRWVSFFDSLDKSNNKKSHTDTEKSSRSDKETPKEFLKISLPKRGENRSHQNSAGMRVVQTQTQT